MSNAVTDDAYLSPAEAARRLGVSAKALRLYEKRGLVKPLRNDAGWRAYGPTQIARLHQVLALKGFGLPLSRIAELLCGRLASLDALLELQEQTLARESGRVDHALSLVRAARAKLAKGDVLSIDDLATLTTETTMTTKATPEEMKAIFDPISAKYFTPEEAKAIARRKFDQPAIATQWEALIAETKVLMTKGDPSSPVALNLARRWQALVDQFTGGDPAIAAKARAVWSEAMADLKAGPKLPLNPEIFAFVGKAMAKLKEQGG
ncbi:MAG: MerR family transcriptional regulator [Alphaproteobacteria bacterium]|nr:MerR family transcriptional regulator [Alphaproteobacteria bacterium]MDE2631427.1 MerR family transcriptional regulator [Alphaproteobacteria bacterium]